MWMIIQASLAGVCLLGAVIVLLLSVHKIGPSEVGLVTKRFSSRKLDDDNLIAFQGEAGYQSELLMPGLRFRWWPLYGVEKFPWVQIPAGQIGVVLAQVGQPLPVGAKSAVYRPAFGQFADLELFIREGGQKGVQRPVLPPGTTLPIHPVAFLVVTRDQTFGLPANPELSAAGGPITPASFGMNPCDFEVVQIRRGNDARDIVGIVNTLEGSPLPSGDISSRLNGFADVVEMEQAGSGDQDIIEVLLGAKNDLHNNYQDFQAFLDHGGQVAVIKSYVGLPPRDTSGAEFKFGTLVRPGHRGIWQEPLRTGKYPINPYCYKAEIVPTAILTLNWAERVSAAHHLDAKLETITAKSAEGFVFRIDLQVQIHVPDTRAPRVISTVGTINNLVDEVLQAAVGNHFRDTLQSMPAISFIEKRRDVQRQAFERIAELLSIYFVETKGVYIQDVLLPQDLVKVLTEREIAKQEIATFEQQKQAQEGRIRMEQARGTADMQAELAKSAVGVTIKTNQASARRAEAEGESYFIEQTGKAKGAEVRAVGLAKAEAYDAQVKSFGANATAFVNAVDALSKSGNRFVPEILVSGSSGGAFDGLAATLMKYLSERKAS